MQIVKRRLTLLLIVSCLLNSSWLQAQENNSETNSNPNGVQMKYGSKGFEFTTNDDRFKLQIQSRLQLRFATPNDRDPQTFDDYSDNTETVLKINRARLKVGGHAFKPWLKYYWEYDVNQSNLLDFRLMIEKWEWLSFKVGQWKVEYTQERYISSGKQQLVDRSILNRAFTIDRQQGAEIYGHLKGDGLLDFNYWAGVFTGTGRGNGQNDDENMMYFSRGQWNFLGREVKFDGSDVGISEKPAGILAVAVVTNRSPYTRFSSAGGGTLAGFENPADGQYRINQMNIETAFKFKGFSWQNELHQKEIIDRINNTSPTIMHGYYAQAGYFFHQALGWWPEPLELAARHSSYYPDRNNYDRIQRETSLAANWFFNGHRNKLTMEVSRFDAEDETFQKHEQWRFRIQWDISL